MNEIMPKEFNKSEAKDWFAFLLFDIKFTSFNLYFKSLGSARNHSITSCKTENIHSKIMGYFGYLSCV